MSKLLSLNLDTGPAVELEGRVNVSDETVLSNIRYAIKQGHPQVHPADPNRDRLIIVGGGPSLEETKDELIALHFQGAKLVTMNGSYEWCLKNNLRPSIHLVVDARDHNARFVEPAVPDCTYLLASQCAPKTWDAVKGRPRVWIWHALGEGDEKLKELLDSYYFKRWHGVIGGTTVATRALLVLRTLGFMQFDLFGVDSCWSEKKHHAYAQPENDADKRLPVRISPGDDSHPGKEFWVAPWHLVQFQNFLNLVQMGGDMFGRITVHGNGLLAYAMQVLSEYDDVKLTEV